jgi:mRNA-degrading endonuclease RelE of RelBE toxin-antitoxin system
MQVIQDKKVQKQLRKLQPKVVKKYKQLINQIITNGLDITQSIEKLKFNKDVMRIKLDYNHRVGVTIIGDMIKVLTVTTREESNWMFN